MSKGNLNRLQFKKKESQVSSRDITIARLKEILEEDRRKTKLEIQRIEEEKKKELERKQKRKKHICGLKKDISGRYIKEKESDISDFEIVSSIEENSYEIEDEINEGLNEEIKLDFSLDNVSNMDIFESEDILDDEKLDDKINQIKENTKLKVDIKNNIDSIDDNINKILNNIYKINRQLVEETKPKDLSNKDISPKEEVEKTSEQEEMDKILYQRILNELNLENSDEKALEYLEDLKKSRNNKRKN